MSSISLSVSPAHLRIAFFFDKPKPIFGFLLRFGLFGGPFPAFPHVALGLGEAVPVARFRDGDAVSPVDVMTVIAFG